MPRGKRSPSPSSNGKSGNGRNGDADLGFEAKLWASADALRGAMDASEYQHVVLGLIFLKYISDAFEELRAQLAADADCDPEDRDEYTARNVFWLPKAARWIEIAAKAKSPQIGEIVDKAMLAIEQDNPRLKNVLPKYQKPSLGQTRLGGVVDFVNTIGLGDAESRRRDVLGRVYEYFLGRFANAEGKAGGEFYTPRSVVRLSATEFRRYAERSILGESQPFTMNLDAPRVRLGQRSATEERPRLRDSAKDGRVIEDVVFGRNFGVVAIYLPSIDTDPHVSCLLAVPQNKIGVAPTGLVLRMAHAYSSKIAAPFPSST